MAKLRQRFLRKVRLMSPPTSIADVILSRSMLHDSVERNYLSKSTKRQGLQSKISQWIIGYFKSTKSNILLRRFAKMRKILHVKLELNRKLI